MDVDLQIAVGDAVPRPGDPGAQGPAAAVELGQGGLGILGLRHAVALAGHPRQLPGAGEEGAVLRAAEEEHAAVPSSTTATRSRCRSPSRFTFGIGYRSGSPSRAARQPGRRGQRRHLGRRGEQRVAPSSIRAWLLSPGRSGSSSSAAAARSCRRAPLASRVLVQGETAREDPLDVAVHDRRGHPEGDARHRRRRVGADSGKLEQALDGRRKRRQPGDLARRGVELARPPVVAETGPERQHLLDLGPRQIRRRWEIFPGSACKKGAPSRPGSAGASPRRARSCRDRSSAARGGRGGAGRTRSEGHRRAASRHSNRPGQRQIGREAPKEKAPGFRREPAPPEGGGVGGEAPSLRVGYCGCTPVVRGLWLESKRLRSLRISKTGRIG